MSWVQIIIRGILLLLAFLVAHVEITRQHPINFAPLYSGPGSLDQIHYLNIGHTISKRGVPGFQYSPEFAEPFNRFLTDPQMQKAFPFTTNDISQQLKTNSPTLALTSDRPPLYPLLLGTSFRIFGYSFRSGRLLNAALFAIAACFVFSFAIQLSGLLPAFLAYSLFVFPHHTLQMTPFFMTEVTASLMVAIFCWWAVKTHRKRSDTKLFILGSLYGALILSRFNFYFCLPAILVVLFWYWECSFQKKLKTVSVFSCGVLFFLLPLFSWNIAVSQRPDFFLGTHADRALLFSVVKGYGTNEPPIVEMAKLTSHYIESNGVTEPNATAWSIAHRAIFWETIKNRESWRRIPVIVKTKISALFSGVVLYRWEMWFYLTSCLAVFFCWDALFALFWAISTSMLISSVIFFPEYGRYLIPCFPIATVCIAATIAKLIEWLFTMFIPSPAPPNQLSF